MLKLSDHNSGRLTALLRGGTRAQISRFAIERGSGHDLRIELTDHESLSYLTSAFRSAVYKGYYPDLSGTKFDASVNIQSLGSVSVYLDLPGDASGFTIGVEDGSDSQFYWVVFPEPRPPGIAAMLDQMRAAAQPR